jgi:hypothetical protein
MITSCVAAAVGRSGKFGRTADLVAEVGKFLSEVSKASRRSGLPGHARESVEEQSPQRLGPLQDLAFVNC